MVSWPDLALLNAAGLLLRLPPGAVAVVLSLACLARLPAVALQHHVPLMTVSFVDLMVIDADTIALLMNIFPKLGAKVR